MPPEVAHPEIRKTTIDDQRSEIMERLLRILEMKRVDPTLMTTHTFPFGEIERAFEMMDKKLEDVIKALIVF